MQRIDFIDKIKGVCIILVIYSHILGDLFEGLRFIFCFHMPIFFCLSGLFFKPYTCYKEFLRKKVNALLVPFVFFYIISYSLFFFKKMMFGSIQNFSVLDFFSGEQMFNISLWFLLSLFIMSNIMYVIYCFKLSIVRFLLVIILGLIGYIGALYDFGNVLFFMSSLTSLPFYYLGCILRENGYLERRNIWELGLGFSLLFIGIFIAFILPTPPRLLYFNNTIMAGNLLEIYTTSSSLVIGLMIILKYILKEGGLFISWIGNNSIVLLVLHMLFAPFIYPIVGILFQGDSMYICAFFIDIILCIVAIPIVTRFIPVFIGKKELLKNNKLYDGK
ncbi:acyltransferase family protein [uncultured Parabacteroides sp.]|jgi:fucose 4-O-acetylase-like acetyltransferase|uniref:acyltransferase family protein n=1 Tax=uncultured Parabacteroides sp. TaxID=512312 RepID=UPI0025D725A2|nr:acyltransferase family protein [uncultured Parabacteroides sp.]